MNPWKNLTGLASWIMRIAIMLMIFAWFFQSFMNFNLTNPGFYMATAFVVLGIMLFVGGFLSKHSLTVLSAVGLLILSALQAYWGFNGITGVFAQWLLMGSVSLYFVTNGNK